MKKIFSVLLGLILLSLFLGTGIFLYNKSQEKPIVYQTTTAEVRDIQLKTIATGQIIPRKEVEIKSQASGVVESIFVESGQKIERNELIAKIRIIPNIERLNAAESQLELARINHRTAKIELERQEKLYRDKIISQFEFDQYQHEFNLQLERLGAAQSNLAIIREGVSLKAGQVSNEIKATLGGLVLDIPVKEGTFVTQTNNFNAGTTIAFIANMDDMIFEGNVDEAEVGKLREGMTLQIKIGALETDQFQAKLEYISPKGFDDQGTVKFLIKASVTLRDDRFLRAGYSANADIVLEQREQVLSISENVLQFEQGKPYVEVEVGPQEFEKRFIQTGLSDGLFTEVLEGIRAEDRIKKPITLVKPGA